ncbi:MAG: class A beta-lactamase-related serine hydrolase [Porphyromonadaceae bacterium]|nr:MAG: class A beta-lactamase-related serine hydrolase [Porphyromonadaceae bacterium]
MIFTACLFIGFLVLSCRNTADQSTTSKEFVYDASPESAGFSSERLARIDTLLNDYISKGIFPNSATFVARHGKVVHYKAHGWKDIENKEPLELNNIFRIASQTKALTTVGLMMLYEKGKFLLDDPISKYIPEFKNPQVLVKFNASDSSYTSRPAKREITIRHLLCHTSGIDFPDALSEKAGIHVSNAMVPLDPVTVGEVIKKTAKLPLNHDPGEGWIYTGSNTNAIGYLIEILSGQPLDEYLRKELFEPLEMHDSYFYLPAEKASRLVTLYSNDSLTGALYVCKNVSDQTYPVAGPKTYFKGSSGVVGTILDYANFCKMLMNGGSFNGKQLLGRKTIDLMRTNQIGDFEVWDRQSKFGLGFELITEKGTALCPGSVGSFDWGGAFTTWYLMDPSEDLIMLIYINIEPMNFDVFERFKILVYQALIDKK